MAACSPAAADERGSSPDSGAVEPPAPAAPAPPSPAPQPEAAPAECPLLHLPRHLLHQLLNDLVRTSNAGQAYQLGMTCAELRASVASHEDLWRRQGQALGWLDVARPATLEAGVARAQLRGGVGREGREVKDSAGRETAFGLYSGRMRVRCAVRRLLKSYIPFLPPLAQRAMRRGAPVAELQQAEAQLRGALPWALWESFRFRDGQTDMPGALFADGARLLSLQEALSAVAAVLAAFDVRAGRVRGRRGEAAGAAAYVGGGPDGDELLLPLSTTMTGSRRVACGAVSGAVYFTSGFTVIRKADSWAAFLGSLLR